MGRVIVNNFERKKSKQKRKKRSLAERKQNVKDQIDYLKFIPQVFGNTEDNLNKQIKELEKKLNEVKLPPAPKSKSST